MLSAAAVARTQPYAMNTHMGSLADYAGAAPPFQPVNVNYNTEHRHAWLHLTRHPHTPSAPNLNQPQNGSAGYIDPPAPQLQNPKPSTKFGFSQFMPSATTKEYMLV